MVVYGMRALLSAGHCRDDFNFHEKFRSRQTLDPDERGGRVVALVESAAYGGAVLAPGLDVEHPGGLFHGTGWRCPCGPQDMADVFIHFLGLAAPVTHPGDCAIGVIGHLASEVEQATAIHDDALIKVHAMVFDVVLLEQRSPRRAVREVDDQLDLNEHGRIGEAAHSKRRGGRSSLAEKASAYGPPMRCMGFH